MNIYLIEPYLTGSHKSWAEGYARWSRHRVHLLTMPGYFWKWRMHGGAVTLAEPLRAAFASDEPPDLLLVSDMIDVTTLLALTRDVAQHVPVVFYVHENQLTYPPPPGSKRDLHYGWINYVSCLVSDGIFFNSRYHLEEWYDELPRLLKHFPDFTHLDTIEPLRKRSDVLYPGVDLSRLDEPADYPGLPPRGTAGEAPLILWNHRWEFDKKPIQFFTLLERLADMGYKFRLALAGESFRNQPKEFLEARERFRDRIVHFGYATNEEYRALLQRSDIVISTAIHEFFGIATVEAIYAGCCPLLPNRLAYPEVVPAEWHSTILYNNFGEALHRMQQWLTPSEGGPLIHNSDGLRASMARFNWPRMAASYDSLFEKLASGAYI
ncbi:MAG: tRNA-queuosine alpha-mannosyltransferase domain-containing protein [Ardenticatenaceae bacterium]